MFFMHASIRLLFRKSRSRIQNLLGFTLVLWMLLELKDVLLYFPELGTERFINLLTFVDGWVVAPCSFLLLELIAPGWINWKRMVALFSPFILFTTIYLYAFSHLVLIIYLVFITVYSAFIVSIIAFATRRYQKYIRNNYSYSEQIDLGWLKRATIILSICLLIWLYTNVNITGWGDAIYYLSSIILWSFIIYNSEYQLSIPIPNNLKGNLFSKAPREEGGDEVEEVINSYSFKDELKRIMEEKKLYLNPRLTISDVANAIGTNRTYLSSYFNNELETTFYDYINNLRIERTSKQLLSAYPQTMNMDEIAERSGFNSTSTFRRAFLKNTGLPPLQYRKSMR